MDTPEPEPIKGPLLERLGVLAGADISPDGKWIATTTLDGTVGLWDTETLAPANTGGPSVMAPQDGVRGTRTYSISIGQFGMYVATSGSLDPTRVWRLPEMKSFLIKPPGVAGQISRTAFNPNAKYDNQIALGATRMVMVYDLAGEPTRVGEPLAVEEAMAQPIYSHHGMRMLTLSGGSWSVIERLRVWNAEPMAPYPDAARLTFSGKNAPAWLPLLAQAVAGRRIALDDEDEKRLRPPTLKRLLDENVIQSPANREYLPVYQRFSDRALVAPAH
jgi:WD40 repeat protein